MSDMKVWYLTEDGTRSTAYVSLVGERTAIGTNKHTDEPVRLKLMWVEVKQETGGKPTYD